MQNIAHTSNQILIFLPARFLRFVTKVFDRVTHRNFETLRGAKAIGDISGCSGVQVALIHLSFDGFTPADFDFSTTETVTLITHLFLRSKREVAPSWAVVHVGECDNSELVKLMALQTHETDQFWSAAFFAAVAVSGWRARASEVKEDHPRRSSSTSPRERPRRARSGGPPGKSGTCDVDQKSRLRGLRGCLGEQFSKATRCVPRPRGHALPVLFADFSL